jgi:hypothetical protein
MGFEFYMHFYRDGELVQIGKQVLLDAFQPFVVPKSEDRYGWWELDYGKDGSCHLALGLEETVTDLALIRPVASPQLMESILRVMQLWNGVLYWPGSRPMIADESIRPHVNEEMIEALGPAVVVGTTDEILAELHDS